MDENGRITEATALLNGWAVGADDPTGARVAGVFTHEFGHAINLSHSQVNGPLVYSSYPFDGYRRYPGVPGCVDPVYASNWYDDTVNRAERQSDYWIFGGIFRPVWLEARPRHQRPRQPLARVVPGWLDAYYEVEALAWWSGSSCPSGWRCSARSASPERSPHRSTSSPRPSGR